MRINIIASTNAHVLAHLALMGQETNVLEEAEREEEGDLTSQATPPMDATEKSNGSSNGRSSQIMYVITTSPDKPEHNMPGQWEGPSKTSGHHASMSPPSPI